MKRKPFYHKGLRFECQGSGRCCRNHGEYTHVYLMDPDVEAIAAHLGLPEAAFRDSYCEEDEGWTVLRMDRPARPFLDAERRCRIYPVRPKQCATWPFWEENLVPERWHGPVVECCPGIGQGRLWSAEEIERLAAETEDWYES